MTGDIKVAAIAADTNVVLKNCAPFTRCVTHINGEHVETTENLDIIMPMYNYAQTTMQILLKVYISLKEMNLQQMIMEVL